LLANGIAAVDAVLYTHGHADHVHGIDDLRALSVRRKEDLPVYGPRETLCDLARRFPYIFDDSVKAPTTKPRLLTRAVEPGEVVTIAGMEVLPLECSHGYSNVLGFRIGGLAYLTDVKSIPQDSLAKLRGVRGLVLNGLFQRSHPTHLSIPEAVELAREIGAERTYLTHLTHESSHEELLARLPPEVEPAYDGLVIAL
jgi:phosphoribosyl 1,2-cyclic phosphate phosphodiesterase